MNDKLIIKVEVPEPSNVFKVASWHSRHQRFAVRCIYHMEDGSTHPATISSERKKDLPERISSEQNYAAAGAMSANFDENGNYTSTCTRFSIGPRGLVPAAPRDQTTLSGAIAESNAKHAPPEPFTGITPDPDEKAAKEEQEADDEASRAEEEAGQDETAPAPNPADLARAQTIEDILKAARRPCPAIVPVHELMCSDGKTRGPNGIPHGITTVSGHPPVLVGYAYEDRNGTRYGTRGESEAELRARHDACEDRTAAELRAHLEAATPAELDSQAAYWLKPRPMIDPTATMAEREPAPSGSVRLNRQHCGIEVSFPDKPAPATIASLKAARFRWSKRSRVWYRKASPDALGAALRILPQTEAIAADLRGRLDSMLAGPDASDIAYEDACARAAGVA